MAKYTTSYADYVRNGGAVPTEFNNIDGFASMFMERYADREIGYETADIFAYKLQLKAALYIDDYKNRIAIYDALIAKIDEDMKRIVTENSDGTATIGAQRSTATALPFNAQTATPNQVNASDSSTNTDTTTVNRTETDYMTGAELQTRMELAARKRNLMNELLEKFESIFMGVY